MSLGFEAAALFDEALENAAHCVVPQRALVIAENVRDDLLFTRGIEYRHAPLDFDLPDTNYASRAFTQQIQNLIVDGVDSGPPVFDGLL
jgi:hypothetical protein